MLGDGHLDVAATTHNLALLHEQQGKLVEARQLFLEVQRIYAKIFGADHAKTLNAARQAEAVGGNEAADDAEEVAVTD